MEHLPKGIHYIIDLFECNAQKLNDLEFIKTTLTETAERANTTILNIYFYPFEPQGITGSIVISESHINIHTWPEHHYVAFDVFTCGDNTFPQSACDYLIQAFEAKESNIKSYKRGFHLR